MLRAIYTDTDHLSGQGKSPVTSRAKEVGWSLRMHLVRMLLNFLPVILVEQRSISWTCNSASVLPLASRLSRRAHSRAEGGAGEQHELVPMPHYSELLKDMSEGVEPGQGNCRDQEEHGFRFMKGCLRREIGGALHPRVVLGLGVTAFSNNKLLYIYHSQQ